MCSAPCIRSAMCITGNLGYELAQVTREATFNPRDLRADLRRAACTELILPEDEAGREGRAPGL